MVRHILSIAEIVDNFDAAVKFYQDVSGILHFGISSRASAAETTFGDPGAADRIPVGFTVVFEVDDVAGTSRSMQTAAGPSLRRRRRSRGVRRPATSSRRAVLCAKSPRRRTHCASSRTCEPRPRADNARDLGGAGRGDRGSAFRENRKPVRLSSTGKRQHAEPGAPSRKQFQTVSSIGSLDMPP